MSVRPRPDGFDAVVFDMDGVVIDSTAAIEHAWNTAALRWNGRGLTTAQLHTEVHGQAGAYTVTALFPDHSPDQHRDIRALVDRTEESAALTLIPGVDALITGLGARGVRVGLVTSSWPAKIANVVATLAADTPFAAVVSRDDVTRGKPDPEPYLTGCAKLGVTPRRTLVFEDSVSGVRAAVAAGATCIGIGASALRDEGAIHTIPDFTVLRLTDSVDGTCQVEGPFETLRLLPR